MNITHTEILIVFPEKSVVLSQYLSDRQRKQTSRYDFLPGSGYFGARPHPWPGGWDGQLKMEERLATKVKSFDPRSA